MKWQMKLRTKPFDQIVSGEKVFEYRLLDEKRKSIRVGDDILFSEIGSGRKVLVEVVGLFKASTFKELELKLKNNDGVIFNSNEMYEYYTQSDEIKYGVLGIKIKVLSKQEDFL